ncbi:UNVERIFIED_CONTAM: hypothetical protein GTU68_030172 [Idotea baltica]|nr:hypothetical protein [Idotea baltica]
MSYSQNQLESAVTY